MHLDCRDLPNGSEIKGDICIVGAGTAGISMALQWINTPYKVIEPGEGFFRSVEGCFGLGPHQGRQKRTLGPVKENPGTR